VFSCETEPFPKPRGYYRIDLPAKAYNLYSEGCAASFEIPVYAGVDVRQGSNSDSCWFNLIFPSNQAVLYCTYLKINGPLDNYLNDAHYMAYSHEMKANAIESTRISRDSSQVHGLVFDLKGEVASQLQFFLTDSSEHFLRGALYFNNRPNPDSIAPVLEFVREDILHMLNTLEWKP
jgi:gliding motility-associated lipoprotein GldD